MRTLLTATCHEVGLALCCGEQMDMTWSFLLGVNVCTTTHPHNSSLDTECVLCPLAHLEPSIPSSPLQFPIVPTDVLLLQSLAVSATSLSCFIFNPSPSPSVAQPLLHSTSQTYPFLSIPTSATQNRSPPHLRLGSFTACECLWVQP